MELAFPELESHLINIVQFAERDGSSADPFRQAALAQAAAAVGDFSFDRVATRESRMRRFALCMQTPRDLLESSLVLGAILGFALVMNAIVPTWASSTRRLLHPFAFVPSVGSVKIVQVNPGDAEVLIGSALPISVRVANPAPHRRRHSCPPGHLVCAPGRQTRIGSGDAARREQPDVCSGTDPGPGSSRIPAPDRRLADPALQGVCLREADHRGSGSDV